MTNFKEDLQKIEAFVFDVDGVFTNGKLYLHPEGDLIRAVNIKDGYIVQYAIKKGYPIAIITGGNSEAVRERFKKLGVTDIYLSSNDKLDDFKDFYFKYGLNPDNILYMGDDIPDFELMKNVGVPTCPADAIEEIKAISKYISTYNGGEGCVRDVIEQVLRLQGHWLENN
ncbi:MAG: HAD-IIIA family hydrolase [Bacteroidales bacterium]|jgi:3-deoxy-D-manno-octulosonate 8-phosphate phosphatase (KDO 8-P phosphatase)|nr:HAD-IIIA family hydrolase [Bacteroidales bacterium]